jgi:hypothetical protein
MIFRTVSNGTELRWVSGKLRPYGFGRQFSVFGLEHADAAMGSFILGGSIAPAVWGNRAKTENC